MWCPESYDSLRIHNTHKYADPLEYPDLPTTCKNTSWSPVTICPKRNGGCKESSWNAFTSCLWRCRNKSENNCWFLTKILLIFVYRIKFLCSFEELKKTNKNYLYFIGVVLRGDCIYEEELNSFLGSHWIITSETCLGQICICSPHSKPKSLCFWNFSFSNIVRDFLPQN